jgi:hypothetical protein
MGLLDQLWDDTVAGPRPDSGLGKLRKYASFSPSPGVPAVTRSITMLRPPALLVTSPRSESSSAPSSPASAGPESPFGAGLPFFRFFFHVAGSRLQFPLTAVLVSEVSSVCSVSRLVCNFYMPFVYKF